MAKMDEENSQDSINLIYRITKESLDYQQQQQKTVEAKASTLIAFAGGMFALLMGARDNLIALPEPSKCLIVVSIFSFGLSVIGSSIVVWVRRYRADPDLENMSKKLIYEQKKDIELQLISNNIDAWRKNCDQLEAKANWLLATFIVQSIAFVLLGIGLLISMIG